MKKYNTRNKQTKTQRNNVFVYWNTIYHLKSNKNKEMK